jgi:hypothetical protein
MAVIRPQAFFRCSSVTKVEGIEDELRDRCKVCVAWLVTENELILLDQHLRAHITEVLTYQ